MISDGFKDAIAGTMMKYGRTYVDGMMTDVEALAQKFKIKSQYHTVEELLKAGGVDALVIGTPNYIHAPQAIAALKAGVSVMVEKPMALSMEEAERWLAPNLNYQRGGTPGERG